MPQAFKDDSLGIAGLVMLLVPICGWLYILKQNYNDATPKTHRLMVLYSRTSLFLPLYAFLMWIAVVQPALYDGIQIPLSFVEAYSFYAIFALIVENIGGPEATVAKLRQIGTPPVCCCYPKADPAKFYTQVVNAIWYVFFIRTPIVLVATICAYKEIEAIFLIASFVALAILGYGLISIVSLYETMMKENFGHFLKIVTVKVSVGIIVVQGLIAQVLYIVGVLHPNLGSSANGFTQQGAVIRYYAFLVLLEYIIYTIFTCYVFTLPVEYTNFTPKSLGNSNAIDSQLPEKGTFSHFVGEVFSLRDVWLHHSLRLGQGEAAAIMKQELSSV